MLGEYLKSKNTAHTDADWGNAISPESPKIWGDDDNKNEEVRWGPDKFSKLEKKHPLTNN